MSTVQYSNSAGAQNWFYRLFLKEIMELLPGALTSSQWAVKAQAARALGTVAKKLGANIQHEIQVSTFSITLYNIR